MTDSITIDPIDEVQDALTEGRFHDITPEHVGALMRVADEYSHGIRMLGRYATSVQMAIDELERLAENLERTAQQIEPISPLVVSMRAREAQTAADQLRALHPGNRAINPIRQG